MNFDFSDEDKLLRDQVQKYLKDHCGPGVVRSVLDGETPFAGDVWQSLIDMGLTGTAVPEAYGGVGAGYLPLCLVAGELGASLAPTPFSSSVYLVIEALLAFGTEAQKQRWLPQLVSGDAVGTLAVVERSEELAPEAIEADVTNGALTGRKLLVADSTAATLLLVLARSDEGLGLYLVPVEAGVSRSAIATVDPTRDCAAFAFDSAPAERLGDDAGAGWQQLQTLYDRAAVLFAFEQLGGAQSALDMAVAYAQERFAFGRPIGSFQGLKHMMADMYVALKLAESNCYYAAWALASDAPELELAAATARISATEAFQLCAKDNIQVHGGMGFTWEFDCHLYYRRANHLALQLGGLNEWSDKLVDALPVGSAAQSAAQSAA